MGVPVATQILAEVGRRLVLATTANGYANTIASVDCARITPFRDFDLPAVNYWADREETVDSGAGWNEYELAILLDARTRTRDRPFVDVAFELSADLWIALWRDPGAPLVVDQPSPRLGGLCTGLALLSSTPAIGEGQAPYCGTIMTLAARYKVAPSDPFTVLT